jgi:hypothetical protein
MKIIRYYLYIHKSYDKGKIIEKWWRKTIGANIMLGDNACQFPNSVSYDLWKN